MACKPQAPNSIQNHHIHRVHTDLTKTTLDWVWSHWSTQRITMSNLVQFRCTVMPSSHCWHQQDKTVLSCLVGGVNRVGNSHRQFSVVLNILETELVLTQFPNMYAAKWKLCQDKTRLSSHHISRLDKTVSKFSVAESLDLSPIKFAPRMPTRQDKTRQSCLVNVGSVN